MKLDDFEIDVHGKYEILPQKMEAGSVGFDIALPKEEGDLVLPNNTRRVIDTGVVIRPPEKCFSLIVPRSSTYNMNVRISNTVGVIDPSYCGKDDTIKVSMERGPEQHNFMGAYNYKEMGYDSVIEFIDARNLHPIGDWEDREDGEVHLFSYEEDDPLVYEAGDRFCQVLFLPFCKPNLVEKKLDEFSEEGRGGFGSTGA
jgi:dUTPase